MPRRTSILQSIAIGVESLRDHPLRTLLSTTGIVIGVLALVATFAVTDGVDRWSRQLIERESSVQDIVVTTRRAIEVDGRVQRLHHVPVFTLEDWIASQHAIPYPARLAARLTPVQAIQRE